MPVREYTGELDQPNAGVKPFAGELDSERNARVNAAGTLFEEQGGNSPLVRLGKGFKAVDVLGRYLGNKVGLVSDDSLRTAAEDFNVGADPRVQRVVNTINDADGFGNTAAALWKALTNDPGAVAGLALEQVPTMALSLPVGGVVGPVVGNVAGKLGVNAGVRAGLTGAGVVSSNTAAQTFPSALSAGLEKNKGDIAAAEAYAAKQAAAEAAIAALFGPLAAKTYGGRVANTLAQGTRGGVSEMAETLGGNMAVGEDTTKGDLLLSGVLGSVMDLPEAAVARRAAGTAITPQAQALADAIGAFDGQMPAAAPIDQAVRQSGVRFDPVAAAQAIRQPAPVVPQLPFDPTVQNPQPVMAVDSAGTVRPMGADEQLDADTTRQAGVDTGLTPDVQRAIAARNVSPAPETAPDVPSDLVQRLIDSGWVPPDQRPNASDGNNPNPDPATVEGVGQDLEQLYQQDVKDGIKRRLGLEQSPAPEPAAPKPPSYAESPFLREIASRGGVNMGERSDTSVDPKRQTSTGRVMPNPYNIAGKPLFRPDGLRGDALVESLVSQGYLTQAQVDEADAGGVGGSDQLAYDMIRKELEAPGSVRPINQQDDVAAQVLQQRASSELQSKARSIGLDTKDLSDDQINLALKRIERRLNRAQGRGDVSREVKAEREAMDDVAPAPDYNYDDSDIPWGDEQSNASEADAMRALGFTDQEIQDAALADRSSPAQARPEDAPQAAPNDPAGPPGPAPADARGEGGQRPDADPQGLTSYTPEELRQRDQRIAEQARAEERRKADEEARAKADSQRGEFALTGSDRPADVAAAGGQTDIFSQPAAQQDQPAEPVSQAGKTEKPKPNGRLTDAGEELIRNRRGKLKGLAWDDVSAMNDTLKVAQVIKSNVWPRPDYAKMVEDGAPAWKAAALKAVYDKLAAAPATRAAPTDSDLRAYIETMGQVRETLMAELDRVERDGTGDKLWASLQSRNVFGKVFPVPADAKPVFGAPSPFDRKSEQGKENNRRALLIGGNAAIQALQFNYKVTSKVKDLLSEGFPKKQEAWQKSYEVRQTPTRDSDVPEGERTGEPQDRFYVYEKGSRWRLAKGVQDGGYATQEQAEAFARTLTAKKRDVLPPSRGLDLADVSRTGPDWRKGQNVTADQVMKHFGFRGVNLGEYVKAKQDVAQAHLNHAFDAFNDLADLLGVPPKAMSLNGTLGVAIGAQGSGKALAHFVPGVNEINITRDSGAGALAHEFGHAVDHYFATQHGRAASMAKRPYLSAVVENVNDSGGVRPEVMGAMRTVIKAINTRPMTEAEAKKYMADQRVLNERRMDRWVAEFKGNRGADPEALAAVAEKLKRGDVGEVRDDDVETNLAEFMRAAGFKPGNMLAANAFTTAYRLRDLADEARFMASHIPQMETNYSKASAALDAKKTGDGYWGTPWEKFARAFETFVMDALGDRQRESLYLSGLVDSKGWQSWSDATGKSIPYPAGDERLVMQQAFQKLVDTIQTKEDDAGNVAMYSRPEGAGASTPDTIRAALRERFGELIPKMEARGFLKIWPSTQAFNDGQTSEKLEGPVQGYWDGKQAHLFADGIAPGNEVAVLLHEVGEHASMEDMLGPNQYERLVSRAHDLVEQGDPTAVRAMDRIPDDTPAQYVDSELLAYMIETVAADGAKATPGARKWLADTVAAIRAWFAQTGFNKMLDRYGKGLQLTPTDIAALAVQAVRWQAEQGTSTAPGGKMATAPRPAQSTAAQQAANVFGGGNATIPPGVNVGNAAGPSAAAAAPWSVAEPGRLDDLIRRLQDSRVDIRRTVDAVRAAGAQIGDDANPYLMDELYIGKVRAQIDRLADDHVTPLLRAISNSGFTPAQVNDYLWARHAEERNRQMAKVNNVPFTPVLDLAGMSTTDANAKLAAARALPNFAQMQAIARMVDTITRDARTRIVTDGLEDASVIQAWEGAYKHYVPLQRDVEESGGKASGYNVKGPEARRAVGSSKEAVNILANVIAQAEATIIRAEKAAVGRSVLDMARQNPNPSFWSVDTPPTERAIDPRTGLVTTRVKPNFKALDNVFVVKEAGVEHFVTFNDKNPRAVQFARSLKNMDAANLGPVMRTINKGTRYLAQWVTSRNPLFWMTNFTRDVQGVAFNLQSTPLKGQAPQVMAKIPQALAGVASNKLKGSGRWAQLAQEFADAGGKTGYLDNYRDSVERMGEIEKDIARMQQGKADPRRVARAVLDVVDGANDVIENGVRLAVYAQAREEGLSEAQSASIAKNISVNFNRKGNDTAAYNALYMFFNANVQGNVRMIQAIKDSRRAQIYAGALTLAGAAVALLNWQLGGDDEESRRKRYQLVPEWERERNWIVFIPGTDSYVKIPLPLGPHVLFNAGRVLSELGLEKGADPMEKAASFASSLIGAFNPVGGGLPSADAKGVAQVATPTVLRPITDLVVNQNFAGTPVAKEKSPFGYNKPAYANGRESTPSYWTTAAKALNDWTGGDTVKPGAVNLSPEQLAYLVKGYAVPGIAQSVDKVAGQAMSRKDTPIDQIVGVSKFFGTVDENERSRAAFDTARKDREKAGQYQAYLKAGEREKANELLTKWGGGDPSVGRKLLGQAQTFERLMTSINRERRSVQALPEDARNERLNRLDERMQRQQAVYLRNRAALIDTPDE